MKMKKYTALLTGIAFIVSCSDWTETESLDLQKPVEKSKEYYQNLRAYKASDHQVAFGWFGGWNPDAPSMSRRLASIPDSVDIVSIWGKYWGISDTQKDDLAYVQNVLGTRVTYTIFAHKVPEPFEATTEGVREYAKALADTVSKYNYDGLDLDYEPGEGAGPLANCHDNELMRDFVIALSKYLGPASGTNKLLTINGVPYAIHKELPVLFNYGIVQSYRSGGDFDLQHRFNNAFKKGWKPEQYIFTEDFEGFWESGGYPLYEHKELNGEIIKMNSLRGMALFYPEIDGKKYEKGGAGTYHMEYDYNNVPDYKYLRQAIQTMNPAGETPTPTGKINATDTDND